MGIGKRLKEQLKLKEMSVKKLAEITKIPPTTLYSIIKRDSNNVHQEILDKIANALNIGICTLLYDENK